MARTQTLASEDAPRLPDPDDPGPRFLSPAACPTVAGTDARRVLLSAGLAPRLNRAQALALLAYDDYDAYETFYEGLQQAPARAPIVPGGAKGLQVGCGRGPALRTDGFEEAAGLLRAVVDEVVHEAVLPFGRVGLLLSGGADSSALAVSVARAWRSLQRDPSDLRFYHFLPQEGEGEEAYARLMSESLGHELVTMRFSAGDCFEGFEPFYARLPSPPDGEGPLDFLRMARLMREEGCEMFLTGDGGDECFGGQRHPRVLRRLALAALPRALGERLKRRRSGEALPGWLQERENEIARLRIMPRARQGLLGERAVRDQRIRCARQAAIVAWHRAMGALNGIESVVPLLDSRVTDLVVSLRPPLLRSKTVEKPLLLEAYREALPARIGRRRKQDQPAVEDPGRQKLRRFGESWRDRWLRGGLLETAGFISRGAADRVIEQAGQGDVMALYRGWSLLGLELWVRAQGCEV